MMDVDALFGMIVVVVVVTVVVVHNISACNDDVTLLSVCSCSTSDLLLEPSLSSLTLLADVDAEVSLLSVCLRERSSSRCCWSWSRSFCCTFRSLKAKLDILSSLLPLAVMRVFGEVPGVELASLEAVEPLFMSGLDWTGLDLVTECFANKEEVVGLVMGMT
jgi:hypothetical protein